MTFLRLKYSGNIYDAAPAGQQDFPLTTKTGHSIPYLDRVHIHVYTSDDQGLTWTEKARPADWDFTTNGTVVRLTSGIAAGDWVRVQRFTPYQDLYTTFQPSSQLTAEQLNLAEKFSMYVDQELLDLSASYWSNAPGSTNTITQPMQETPDATGLESAGWLKDDLHIATTGAISSRFDVILSDTKPADPAISEYRQGGKFWIDTTTLELDFWDPAAGAWISTGLTGPPGPPGPNAYFGPVAPVDPTPYGLWFNTVRNELFVKDTTGPTVQWLPSAGPPAPAIPAGVLVAGNGVAADTANHIDTIDQGVI